jgi:hypothetical protein
MRFLLFLVLVTCLGLVACEKKTSNPQPAPVEYVADTATFRDYCNWVLDSTYHGISNNLEFAHTNGDTSFFRYVYNKGGRKRVNGKYPDSTIIAKLAKNRAGVVFEVVGLVKRGGNFSPNGGGWEWFLLNENGTIAKDANGALLRGGANFLGGGCIGCHNRVSGSDFVFTK